MKKIVLSILILFSLILLGTTSNAASDFTLKELDFDVTLNSDGSMNVVETWDITVHSLTNTLFKTFDLEYSKYSGISDVKVLEIDNNGKEVAFNEKNEEVLHVDKNCYYGLINSKGDYEIAWGINEKTGNKTYKVSYKIKDCIKKYNDISELYWQFIGNDFQINIDKITGTINIPNNSEDKTSIKAWAHGPLNGNINIDSAKQVSFELEYFDSGNYVEVRLAMPNEIFTGITHSLRTDRLDTILKEEQNLADQANKVRDEMIAQKQQQEKFLQNVGKVLQVLGIVLSFVFITRINKYEKELIKSPELKPDMETEYYRDIPRENATPGEAAFLYYFKKGGMKNHIPKVLSATMLSLAYKNYIRFEMEEGNDNKEQIKVVVLRKDATYLKTDEREIYELLKRIQDENSGFSMKELEIYAKDHYSIFLGKLDRLQELVEEQLKKEGMYNKLEKENSVLWWAKVALYIICMLMAFIIMGVVKNVPVGIIFLITSGACAMYSSTIAGRKTGLNQNSINEKEEWEGLKRYMEDYSMIEDREVPELVIWEKYLVYATVFGIADKVLKQLKMQYPELEDGTYIHGAYMGMMYQNGLDMALINSINKSTKNAYNTGVSQRANDEYDYSNSSSGGGFGGGFSGGGGFGGGRRRPVAVVNTKKKREKWSKKEKKRE